MNELKKSFRWVLQNSTNELLTIEGFRCVQGQWVEPASPGDRLIVPMQSTVEWASESSQAGVGTEAFVRLGSTKGYIHIKWNFPWCGGLTHQISAPDEFATDVYLNEELPDHPILVAELRPASSGALSAVRNDSLSACI